MTRLGMPLFVCCFATGMLVARFAHSDEERFPGRVSAEQLRETGFVPIGDGHSLDAWKVEPWHEGHWVAREGIIDYDGKAEHKNFNTNSLWTKQDYTDLDLYVEWRLPAEPRMKPHPIVLFNGDFLLDDEGRRITRPRLDAGDSGILLRGVLNCQANIWCQELGSGEINGYRANRKMPADVRRSAIPITNADRPPGAWNVFLIKLQNNHMSVRLNDEQVIEEAYLPGLPETGPIGLQHHGDPVQFRNLWVRELN